MPNGLWNRLDQWTRLSRLSFPVPPHANRPGYCLGGVTLTGFLILFATGQFLGQVFDPDPKEAASSIRALVETVWGGGWIRSLHYWTAQAVVLSMCAHLLRVFFAGSYKFPRVLTWYVGTGLFFTAVMLAYFSGTVIKWDQEASEALEHYEAVAGMLGPLGALMGRGPDGTAGLYERMYALHISLSPLLLVALVIAHFYLIHVFNLSPLSRGETARLAELPKDRLTGTFTGHLAAILRFSLIYYGLVAILAFVWTPPLGPPPSGEPTGVKPPWIYLWQYGIENAVGVVGILYGTVALLLLFLLVPVIDRGPSRDPKNRKGIIAAGLAVIIAMLALTLYAWLSPPRVHEGHIPGGGHGEPPGAHPGGDEHGMPHEEEHTHPADESKEPSHEHAPDEDTR